MIIDFNKKVKISGIFVLTLLLSNSINFLGCNNNPVNVKSLPAVVINGKLADCCSNKGIDIDVLKSLGLGMS